MLKSKQIGPGDYGFCLACNSQKTDKNWCPECHPKLLLKENPGWTSGYKDLDDFIIKIIKSALRSYDYLEWIPFENFKVIKKIGEGGFATAYLATRINCLKGHFTWDAEKKQYFRESYKDYDIALKCFHNREDVAEAFLNEIKTHHECMMRQENGFLQCYGISRNPETNEFVIVLDFAQGGDLRKFLIKNHKNLKWIDRLQFAMKIAKDLKIIHEVGLVHGDFHSGNILQISKSCKVSDFGLSRKDTDYNSGKGEYGVIPYVAPEVLSGNPYRKHSDIYSYGIILNEIATGKPAFYNQLIDTKLAIKICKGVRPEFSKKTPQCYVKLMEKCLDGEPKKRPTAEQLYEIFLKWYNCVKNREKSEIFEEFKTADENITSEDDNKDEIEFMCEVAKGYTSKFIPFTQQIDSK